MAAMVGTNPHAELAPRVNSAFGIKLQKARLSRSLTQTQVALRAGFSRVTIANLESGKQNVQLHQVFLFAQILDIPVMDLVPKNGEFSEAQPLNERVRSDLVSYSDFVFLEESRALLAELMRNSNEESTPQSRGD
jgi:transcriptional regulator with XRE-family HTH domain